MNLRDHIAEWLDSIGADGLMVPAVTTHIYQVDSELERVIESWGLDSLVPAYRHADGTWHEEAEYPCPKCMHFNDAIRMCKCSAYVKWSTWLSHKGEAK